MDVLVRLGGELAVLPTHRTFKSDAAGRSTTALEGMVPLLRAVNPREEQSDVAIGILGTGAQSPDEIAWLEVLPSDLLSDCWQANSVGAWSTGVESHCDEPGAVGSVAGSVRVRIGGAHGVRDVPRNPVLAAGDNFFAGDLAVHFRGAAASRGTITLSRNHAVGARLHIVVGNVAAVGSLVPYRVSEDALAIGLAGKFNTVALAVCLDALEASSRA